MNFLIVSSANLSMDQDQYSGYAPYIREMEIWAKHVENIGFASSVSHHFEDNLSMQISFNVSKVFLLKSFNVQSISEILSTVPKLFYNIYQLFSAMFWADHIHLRCPGNISLLGCIVQIFFPRKIKTAKYAGNWDPGANQPLSYKIQRWILSNTAITKNMTVLVYGNWPNSSKNIRSFFTATYSEKDKSAIREKDISDKINFMYAGTLSKGKQPLYAVKLFKKVLEDIPNSQFFIYGEGPERLALENFIRENQLQDYVHILGNQNSDKIRESYINSHFLILPSRSEGWPKVVAEAMFWKCVPICTKISCVPDMFGNGSRGIIISGELENDAKMIVDLLLDSNKYHEMANRAMEWSRQYTLEFFEDEIAKLLRQPKVSLK